MALLIGFLTFILVVNCLFLMLLVLVQLPKKEAGAGLAFGAGAVDTLIGAGSGNALTKMTKYAAGSFLALAVLMAVLNGQRHQSSTRALQEQLSKRSGAGPILPATPPAKAPTATVPANTAATPAATTPNNAATAAPTTTQPGPTIQLNPAPAATTQPAPTTPPADTPAPVQQPAPAK
jgi:protein translocase SecG subunit